MKRLAATTILLGVMALAFLIPVALLFAGTLVLILNRVTNGIGAGTGGFSISSRSVSVSLLIIILMLAAFISWLTQRVLKRQKSRG